MWKCSATQILSITKWQIDKLNDREPKKGIKNQQEQAKYTLAGSYLQRSNAEWISYLFRSNGKNQLGAHSTRRTFDMLPSN